MTEIILRDLSAETHQAIQQRAEQNRRSPEEEICAILDVVTTVATNQGIGSALRALGREFNITTEFDNLRDPPVRAPVLFE